MNLTNYVIKYSVWKRRILPILEASGWNSMTVSGRTYMVNSALGQRFEYREYARCSPVLIGTLEVID